MVAFIRIVASISRAFGVLAAAMITLAVLTVCEMVIARYVFGESTVWQTPFATYLLMGATFLGSPYILLLRGHVNVDLVPIYTKGEWKRRLAYLAFGVSLLFAVLVFWTGAEFWWESYTKNWMSDSIWRIPLWIPYLSLPLGFGLLVLQLVADIMALMLRQVEPFAPLVLGTGHGGVEESNAPGGGA